VAPAPLSPRAMGGGKKKRKRTRPPTVGNVCRKSGWPAVPFGPFSLFCSRYGKREGKERERRCVPSIVTPTPGGEENEKTTSTPRWAKSPSILFTSPVKRRGEEGRKKRHMLKRKAIVSQKALDRFPQISWRAEFFHLFLARGEKRRGGKGRGAHGKWAARMSSRANCADSLPASSVPGREGERGLPPPNVHSGVEGSGLRLLRSLFPPAFPRGGRKEREEKRRKKKKNGVRGM